MGTAGTTLNLPSLHLSAAISELGQQTDKEMGIRDLWAQEPYTGAVFLMYYPSYQGREIEV